MSLRKAIQSRKEHRKPFRGKRNPKNISRSCQNHGGCPYCTENRLKKEISKINASNLEIAIWLANDVTELEPIKNWLDTNIKPEENS